MPERAVDIIQILQEDYQRFPADQTYSIYAKDVFFKDPLNEFRGVERYKKMIQFIDSWFIDVKMDLHDIRRNDQTIKTEWILRWKAPLPWHPPMAISGWSELQLNTDGLIVSHIDYWNCSRWDVIKQLWFPK